MIRAKKGLFLMLAATLLVSVSALAQPVAEGNWINLFDKETLLGWTSFGDVKWEVAGGNLVAPTGTGGWLASTCQFADFELAVKMKVTGKGQAGLSVRTGLEGHPSQTGGAELVLNAADDWYTINVKALGSAVSATVDGKPVEGFAASRLRGYLGINYLNGHADDQGPKIEVSEVKLRPLSLTPLFNGKDLEGWSIIPEHKSVFSVVDGALNIKNGNGQIETKGTYQDFVLQLDIMANGKAEKPLNSGVFFRGPVGVFWKGYESQVRNEFESGDRSKAVDYGTGGLYGDQDARKVVPTEGEWFQKTVICEGNHIAIWVNGYQVTDYYDNRPISPNNDGKSGFVPGPGTIHLQGHDPTTDMFFKNIHVQEYPK